jgi:hypothetical protein
VVDEIAANNDTIVVNVLAHDRGRYVMGFGTRREFPGATLKRIQKAGNHGQP